MATWWISEAIPIAATSLLPLALLPLLGVPIDEAAAPYANPLVFLSNRAETTSTGSRSALPSPQPLSPLGRGALGQAVPVVLEPSLGQLL